MALEHDTGSGGERRLIRRVTSVAYIWLQAILTMIMITRKTHLLFAGLLLNVFTLPVVAQQADAVLKDKIARAENSLAAAIVYSQDSLVPAVNIVERMKELNVKGISIAVINNYTIEWAKAYGWADEAEHRQADVHTLFQAASISKTINSLGLLKLVQMGMVGLDTDVNRYLKTWKLGYDSISAGTVVTLRSLLSHSAGMGVSGFSGYERGTSVPRIDQILDGIPPANSAAVRFIAKPGSRFEYSGGGTTIAQLLLTDVTGERYDSFMSREVFRPLQMTDSRYVLNKDTANIASGYYSDGKAVKGKYHIYPEYAAAGLWTTPSDLAKYMIDCQLTLEGKPGKVLSPSLMQERFKPVVMYNESKVALGVFLRYKNGAFYFNHNGGNEGFTCASYGSLKDGYGIVVMTNSNNSQLMLEVCNSVARVYNWDRFYVPAIIKTIMPAKEMLESLVGVYSGGQSTMRLLFDDRHLYLQPDNTSPAKYKVHFLSDSSFVVPDYTQRSEYHIRHGGDGSKASIELTAGNRELTVTKQ